MFQILHKLKDIAAAEAAKYLINEYQLQRFGEISNLTIDSQNKEIHCSLKLKGETEPILCQAKIQVRHEVEGQSFILVERVNTSREWITLLATDLLARNSSFPLTPAAAQALKAFGF